MLKNYLKAGYPALAVETQEAKRFEELAVCDGFKFVAWDCVQGIRALPQSQVIEEIQDPIEALKYLDQYRDIVMLARDLNHFLDNLELLQFIQFGVYRWKSIGNSLVIVCSQIKLPPELEKLFTILDMPLPNESELYAVQQQLGSENRIKPNRKAARAAQGLTEFESEAAFAFSAALRGFFCCKTVSRQKAQIIKKSGLLEYWEPESMKSVGGLDRLKEFITNRAKAFEDDSLPKPPGILLVGVPGTGKSLSCKAAASVLGFPLIRLDIGALKGSLVGESENRIRQATKTIDGFGNAVLWIDEIEKSFGNNSGQLDGNTTSGMLAHMLTWMQETQSPVLVMATANNIASLPPEFIRRFDRFFVDLPTRSERKEIIKIMNRKYGSEIPIHHAEKLVDWSGSEIETLARDSLFDGFETAYASIVPISKTMREEVRALRDWAKTRARFANSIECKKEETRKIQKGG